MLSIKSKFQLFIPYISQEDVMDHLRRQYVELYKRKTPRLLHCLTNLKRTRFDFVAGDTTLKSISGIIYNENNVIAGGYYMINPVIKEFLHLYNFTNKAVCIFNKNILTEKNVKFLSSALSYERPSFVSDFLFNILVNQDLKSFMDTLPKDVIESIVTEWAIKQDFHPGDWQYDPETGVQFNRSVEEVIAEIKQEEIETSENEPITVAEGVPLDLTVTPDDTITIAVPDTILIDPDVTAFLDAITNGQKNSNIKLRRNTM